MKSTVKRIWSVLAPAYRRKAVVLSVLMVVGMLLEMVGVGLVVPAMTLLTANQAVRDSGWLRAALEFLGHPTDAELIGWGLVSLLAVYVGKAAFLLLLAWRQAWFVAGVQADVSKRLFATYLAQPWTFHLQRNSAPLIRNCTSEVQSFAMGCGFVLTIATESLVLVGIGLLVLALEPVGTLCVAAVLGLSSLGLNALTYNRLLRWGEQRLYHDGRRVQHLQQGLGGAKDVKLLGRESAFVSAYELHNLATARLNQRQTFLQSVPRVWYELLAISGLVSLGLYLLWRGRTPAELLPTLAVFAAAAFRVLPSANRLLLAVQNLRYVKPVVDTLYAELSLTSPPAQCSTGVEHVLEDRIVLRDVGYRYPKASAAALLGVSLTIRRGESVGFIGGSGAGKSTLVDLILGLLQPTEGRIEVDGVDIGTCLRNWQTQIGYVPQSIFLTDDSIRRNVAFGVAESDIDDAAVRRALQAAQLIEFIESLPNGVSTMVGERGVRLSGGQRQRIGIARALYHDPPVLVLDEATSALDTDTEVGVMEAVNLLHGTKTLLIVAHRFSTVSHCDRLFQLDHGRLIRSGTFHELTVR